VDGQEITVTVPSGYAADWLNEGAPRLCMVLDDLGGEVCDPTAFVPSYDRIDTSATGDTARYVLRRTVFSPRGWRDCNDEGVTCRLVVLRLGGTYAASDRLVFDGPRVPATAVLGLDPPIAAEGDTITVTPSGLAPAPLADRFATGSSTGPWYALQVCAYEPRRTSCFAPANRTSIDDADPNVPVELVVHREYFGTDGWRDCAQVPCYLRLAAGNAEWWEADTATPLPIRADVPPAPRPSMSLTPDGPYDDGQSVMVRAVNMPEGEYHVAICRRDDRRTCGFQSGAAVWDGVLETSAVIRRNGALGADCTVDPCVIALSDGGQSQFHLVEVPLVVRD
jgi:hypothetical protein